MMHPKIGKKNGFSYLWPRKLRQLSAFNCQSQFCKNEKMKKKKKNQNISTHMRPGFDAVADPLILQRAELYNTYTLCWTCEIESKHNI